MNFVLLLSPASTDFRFASVCVSLPELRLMGTDARTTRQNAEQYKSVHHLLGKSIHPLSIDSLQNDLYVAIMSLHALCASLFVCFSLSPHQ